MAAVFFDLLSQSFDVGIDGARLDCAVVSPDGVEQAFAAEDMAGPIGEVNEQLKAY